MKTQLLITFILCTLFIGCSKTPEQTAKAFTEELHKGKLSEAKKYVTEPSARLLEAAGALGVPQEINPDFRFELADKTVDGNKAIVRYKDTKGVKSLTLVRIDGAWKIDLEAFARERERQEKAKELQDLSNAKKIVLACILYAGDNDGKFPTDLKQLRGTPYPQDASIFTSAFSTDHSQPSYDYMGGEDTDPPKKVLLRGRFTTSDGRRVVAYVDGSVLLTRDTK